MKSHEEDPDVQMEAQMEATLRAALARESAPPDFAAKVLARAAAMTPPQKVAVMPAWRRPATWAMAAALAVAAVIPPAVSEYQRRREQRALEAKRELLVALSITRAKLRQTRERIQRNTRHTL